MQRDIYCYTTESDRLKNRVKIGETVKQSVDKRIQQQDTTSNSEPLQKIGEISGVSFTDTEIRKEIERLNLGCVHRKEWMRIFGGVSNALKAVRTAINSLQLGVVRANSYGMRPPQQECHDKALAAFIAGYGDFLMGTVMRFGKTFTSLMIAETLGAHNVLVITGKPEVRDSWKNELEQHVNFVDWNFVDLRDGTLSSGSIDFTKKNLFFVSFQYLLSEAEGVDKTWISNLPIDMLLTDEEHHASKTEKSRTVLDSFGSVRTIAMSGTPIESQLSGRYEEANSFYWSYREAAQNNPAFPKLTIYGMDVAQDVAREAAAGGFVAENAFHINKMFATENGKFLYETDMRSWLEKVFDLCPMSRTRRMDSPEQIPGLQGHNFNHILMRVPYSVDAAVALTELLTELLSDRKIILAAGSANGAVRNIVEVKRLIAQNDKTITVTCGRFETGVTVPEWGAVYLCDGGRSPEAFWQLIFRASTPCTTDAWKKKEFYVFDFDPHRTLEMVYTVAAISRQSGQDMATAITQWLDVAPILQHDGSQFMKVDADNVLRAFDNMTAGNMLERYASEFGIRDVYKAADVLADFSTQSRRKLEKIIAENPDLEKGKLKKLLESSVPAKEKAELRLLKEKLKAVLRRIPMVLPKLGAVDLRSLLNTDDAAYFKATVGISLDEYAGFINDGVIDGSWQNECIISTANYLSRIGNDDDALWKILGLYASMGAEVSPGTPRLLANEILDQLPPEVWSNPATTFCNLNLSDGTFYFLMVDRLMRGLERAIESPSDRLRHILAEQVYGLDHKEGPLGFVRAIAAQHYRIGALGIDLNLIHENILEGEKKMKFDVVVGNPAYQSNDGGGVGSSAVPIYNKFIEIVTDRWAPQHFCFLIPSRWMVGGKGLTQFRRKMLQDEKIKFLKVYPNSKECFPDNDIKGGICWFVRGEDHTGSCSVTVKAGDFESTAVRQLDEIGDDLFIVDHIGNQIAKKVLAKETEFMDTVVSSRKPFGLDSKRLDVREQPFPDAIQLYQLRDVGYVHRNKILKNDEWLGDHKVLIPKASDGKGGFGLQVLGKPIVANPNSACTETYLVTGRYDTAAPAQNLASFLKTRFVRFMVSLVKTTQNSSKGSYRFVPHLDMTKKWTDAKLYVRYSLTQEEIDFIEKKVKVMV